MSSHNTRKLTILAQDPLVRTAGRLVFATVDLPYEELAAGPVGYRVKVVDFDASANVLYKPYEPSSDGGGTPRDPYARSESEVAGESVAAWEARLLSDPGFHAQHVYAIVMRVLARFEFALGRRVAWGFEGHQLHVAPHAFCDANAYYSETDKALFFGYFDAPVELGGSPTRIYTCLSHDIVAHETTHALLDGIRDGFTDPSSPDQAAFHEGFADVVALLSMFSLPEVVERLLGGPVKRSSSSRTPRLIKAKDVSSKAILGSMLLGLGKEFGVGLDKGGVRADCLRRSVRIDPDRSLLASEAWQDPHVRGEIFAAAMLRSFVALWTRRIQALGTFAGRTYNLDLVVEEGARAAGNLLTMAIRALDYCPPVDLSYGAYLSALLTADMELIPDDARFGYREQVVEMFASYGIDPEEGQTDRTTGAWQPFQSEVDIVYTRNHAASMLHDKEEVFRFVWENRVALDIDERGYVRITSVRPSTRQGPDGFFLRETICEYVEVAQLFSNEAKTLLGLRLPAGMGNRAITVYGGGTLVFDQFGHIKYHIKRRLNDSARQSDRLEHLYTTGQLDSQPDRRLRFANLHRCRAEVR